LPLRQAAFAVGVGVARPKNAFDLSGSREAPPRDFQGGLWGLRTVVELDLNLLSARLASVQYLHRCKACTRATGHTTGREEPRKAAFPQKVQDWLLTMLLATGMVRLMEKRLCALDGCQLEFEPQRETQKFCSPQHSSLSRVRRMRARRHRGGGDGGNGGGPPNGGLYATIGGAVEYGQDGSATDHSRYYVKPAKSLPPWKLHLVLP
jgi:hypothetical protein